MDGFSSQALGDEPLTLKRSLRCYHPFQTLNADRTGTIHACSCPVHRQREMGPDGNSREQSIESIWNGERLRQMREAFLAGDYGRFCNTRSCSLLYGPPALPPTDPEVIAAVNEGKTVLDYGVRTLIHEIDHGCNLHCVHCREEKIPVDRSHTKPNIEEVRDLIRAKKLKTFYPHGWGEVLIMKDVVELLASNLLVDNGVSVELHTNLLPLRPSLWARIGHNTFSHIVFSVDGCSSATYDAVRRGGSWERVHENMRYLASLRVSGHVQRMTWAYCVMKRTMPDVQAAVRLARELPVDLLYFQALSGHLPGRGENIFEESDVAALDHLHDALAEVGAFDDPTVRVAALRLEGRPYRRFDTRVAAALRLEREGEPEMAQRVLGALLDDAEQGTVSVPTTLEPSVRNWVRWMVSGPLASDARSPRAGFAPFALRHALLENPEQLAGSRRVFVYGSGASGRDCIAWLRQGGVEPLGVIDSFRAGRFLNLPMTTLEDYAHAQEDGDAIVVASMFRHEILAGLEATGVKQCWWV
ncbi:radical SAM protein [Azospirillum tabaci]|uniref:radical SAM protein n=1 Tax=Azospirillum tabaci TaxID=2752310 RepID=UPI0016615ED3|nr:radical SAM protein [Azospirillum tabaci]